MMSEMPFCLGWVRPLFKDLLIASTTRRLLSAFILTSSNVSVYATEVSLGACVEVLAVLVVSLAVLVVSNGKLNGER